MKPRSLVLAGLLRRPCEQNSDGESARERSCHNRFLSPSALSPSHTLERNVRHSTPDCGQRTLALGTI